MGKRAKLRPEFDHLLSDQWSFTGELTVWTGYNGHGKSLLLSQVLLGLMQQDQRVVVFENQRS